MNAFRRLIVSILLSIAILGGPGCLFDGDPATLDPLADEEHADDDSEASQHEAGDGIDGDVADEGGSEEAWRATLAPELAALPTCFRTANLDTGGIGPIRVPSAGTSEASTSCIMGVGAVSAAVERLQVNLNRCYQARLREDSQFGRRTREALESAQNRAGVADDGVYGPITRDALVWWTGSICFSVDGPGGL